VLCQLDSQLLQFIFFQLFILQPCAVKLAKSWSEMPRGAARQVDSGARCCCKGAALRSVFIRSSSWNSEGRADLTSAQRTLTDKDLDVICPDPPERSPGSIFSDFNGSECGQVQKNHL
jgi:hypothetical protein